MFVADVIPHELRRVVEFLNEQMDPAEVLAIEIAQFLGTGVRTLVPRILGQTEAAQQRKGVVAEGRELIAEAEFYESFDAVPDPKVRAAALAVGELLASLGLRSDYVRGKQMLSHIPILDVAGSRYYPLSIRKDGIFFQGPYIVGRPPFTNEAAVAELEARLREVAGVKFKASGITGKPEIPWASVVEPAGMAAFMAFVKWLVEQVQQER